VIADLPRLHAVTDDRVVESGRIVERATAMAEAAGSELAVHLRTRRLTGRQFWELARELGGVLSPRGGSLVVNDRADIARAVGARAVVSGRAGLPVADLRRAAPSLAVGRSVHDGDEARQASAEGADFLIAGAVYATASHPEVRPGGTELVREAAATGRPVVAIGGMTPERVPGVLSAGAWGVAAIRALWDATDPAAAARDFVAALPGAPSVSVTVNGESRRAPAGSTLASLLQHLALDPRTVVVEHNRRIVRRDSLATTALSEGDAIELVHFVGGG
jgi:thiamine biosynthesis protein ThiS